VTSTIGGELEAIRITSTDALEPAGQHADEELASRARTDVGAWGELYLAHRESVFGYLRARCRDEDEALELTAVTFEKAWRAFSRYRARDGGMRAWLARIARNAAIDHDRRRRPLVGAAAIDVEHQSSEPSPEDTVVTRDERHRLRLLVAALPELQRDAVAMRYGVGLTAREIGLVIGKGEEATQKLITRALARLKEAYRDQF
jgi:RNA polymerase sigma-70 factor (ECF subfamily)